MQPAFIRVFDGLRITTEHLDHFQGSLHSAVSDLRAILGLGLVFRGFEVGEGGDDTIVVQPGLAFDHDGNRITSDEPTTLRIPEDMYDPVYICVRYEQVEDGVVDGRATLVWDSASVTLRESAPEPAEGAILLATVRRRPDPEVGFEILVPPEPEAEEFDEEEPIGSVEDAEPTVPSEADLGQAGEEGAAALPEPEDTNSYTGETSDEAVGEGAAASSVEAGEGVAVAAAETLPSADETGGIEIEAAPSPTLRADQGHITFESDAASSAILSTTLAQALAARLRVGGGSAQLLLKLDGTDVSLGFPPTSITFQSLLRATLVPDSSSSGPPADGVAEEPETPFVTFEGTSRGEAAIDEDKIEQFGFSEIVRGGRESGARSLPTFTGRGIAHLGFERVDGASETDEIPPEWRAFLEGLELLIQVAKPEDPGFGLECRLAWSNSVTEETIAWVERYRPELSWWALVAWKALGGPASGSRGLPVAGAP